MVTRPRNLPQADPYFDSVVLLCPLSGEDGDTTTTDLSNEGHTMTFDTNASLDSSIRKFGFTSCLFDDTAGNGVSTPTSAAWANLKIADGFTVEAHIRMIDVDSNTNTVCSMWSWTRGSTTRSWFIGPNSAGALVVYVQNAGSSATQNFATASSLISAGVWHHVVFQCQPAGNFEVFVDGTRVANVTPTIAELRDPTDAFCIGATDDDQDVIDGYVENVRITKGVARYTDGFTPPERAFLTQKTFGIVRDDLIFAYDMSDSYGSWQGEPTTNLANTAGGAGDWGNLDLGSAVITRSTLEDGKRYRITSTIGGGGRMTFDINKLTDTETYNVSFKYKIISGGPTFTMTDWCDTSITKTTTVFDTYTYETAYGSRAEYIPPWNFMDYSISDDTTVEIWDVQLEERAYATPYTQTSRDNTEAIIDWAGDHTITASSLTYGTDNTFSFNGTTDYLQTSTLPSTTSADVFSVEFVIRPDSTASTSFFITPSGLGLDRHVNITTGAKLQLTLCQSSDIGGRSFDSTASVSTTKLQHWVITVNGTDINFYLNGELDSNHTDTSGFSVGQWGNAVWYIGQRGNSTFWYAGDIHAVQFYDRAITPGEVRQNHTDIKGRFNI